MTFKLAGDLLRAPLRPHKLNGILFHQGLKVVGIAGRSGEFAVKFPSLFGFIASTHGIATQLATARGHFVSKKSGNLRDVELGFRKTIVLLITAEMLMLEFAQQ